MILNFKIIEVLLMNANQLIDYICLCRQLYNLSSNEVTPVLNSRKIELKQRLRVFS